MELLLKSINHTWEYTDITDEEINIILACWKSILTGSQKTWVKSHMDNFDVPMCAYILAQIADLTGICILDTLGWIINLEQIGLYWDDKLIFPKTSKIHKKIVRAFLDY